MTAPITPDERAAMREGAESWDDLHPDDTLRLLDALDTAEAEAKHYRAQRDEWFLRESGAREAAEAEVALLRTRIRKARHQRDEARAEVARYATRPAPAWDEEAVAEAFARAIWAHGAGEAAYLVADLARMWDESTLPQDPETQHSVRVIRAQAAAVLAVVRDHLPVKPSREGMVETLYENRAGYLDDLADAVLALWPGESRAQVRLEALREMWDAVDARMLKLAEGGTYPDLVEDLANLLTAVQTELDGGPRWADRPVAEGGDDRD